ncbi:hypothetical protein BGU85_27100, partial [Clostridioides difficile]
LLDGFSRGKKLIKRAKELNMSSIAITDHGCMFGVIDFYKTAILQHSFPDITLASSFLVSVEKDISITY